MWQTSDKVSPDTITAVTDNCEEVDCKLSAKIGQTTLVANRDYYDRAGRLHIEDDSNSRSTRVDCGTCWRVWNVHHNYGKIERVDEITTEEERKFMARTGMTEEDVRKFKESKLAARHMTYQVVRTDDHGNPVVVQSGMKLKEADDLCTAMTMRGHKQTYEVKPDEKKLDGPADQP